MSKLETPMRRRYWRGMSRDWLLSALLMATCGVVVVSACGGTAAAQREGSVQTTVPHKIKLPVVVGKPVLASQSYPLPDQTGYVAVVVFTVKNPNRTDLRSVPYRVTALDSRGQPIQATSGQDTFAIRGRETRAVVNDRLDSITDGQPISAQVTIYTPTNQSSILGGVEGPQAKPSQWKAQGVLVNCNTGTTACQVTGNLLFTGSRPQKNATAYAVIHQGQDNSGPVVGGGVESVTGLGGSSGPTTISPGDTVPLSFTNAVVNQGQTTPPFSVEIYVESFSVSGK